MTALKTGQIQRTYVVADRGDRPAARCWFHLVAAALSAISSAVLITFGWMTLPWPQALGVTIYGAGVVLLFAVSAMYHRWPWRSPAAVQWWRRADHATISVFIAATYTPLCLIVFEPHTAAIMLAAFQRYGLRPGRPDRVLHPSDLAGAPDDGAPAPAGPGPSPRRAQIVLDRPGRTADHLRRVMQPTTWLF